MRQALDTTRIALVYPRQSTATQVAENVYSLEGQLRLRELALAHGFPPTQVVVIVDDLGVSGRTIHDRVGMSRALELIDQGQVAAVYCEDMTRLSRDAFTVDHMIIAKHCQIAGVLLYMSGSWYDLRDSGNRTAFKYMAVGDSEGWGRHMEKLVGRRRDKAAAGKIAAGVPPRGYRTNKEVGRSDLQRDRAVVYEPEAAVIRSVLARWSEARGLRPLWRAIHPTYWPDGTLLKPNALRRVLTHPFYRGAVCYGDVRVEGAHPALVPPELAAEIDETLAVNRAARRRPPDDPSQAPQAPGLVRCSCGRRTIVSVHDGVPVYQCARRRLGGAEYHWETAAPPIDAAILAALWPRLAGGLASQVIVSLHGQRAVAVQAEDAGDQQRRILRRRRDGLTLSLADPDLGPAARRALAGQLEEVAGHLELLEKRLPLVRELDVAIARFQALDTTAIALAELTWEDTPLDLRRGWIRMWVTRVEALVEPHGIDLTITFLDGSTAQAAVRRKRAHPIWLPDEDRLFRELLVHPDRPPLGGSEWPLWVQARLAQAGYERSLYAVRAREGILRTGPRVRRKSGAGPVS